MYLVSRTETFAKLFFIVSFTGLFMYVALAFYSFHTAFSTVSTIGRYQDRLNKFRSTEEIEDRFDKDLKYILVWTLGPDRGPSPSGTFLLGSEGQTPFIENDCPEINCYITTNKTILNNNYTNFDSLVFNMSLMMRWGNAELPKERTKRQKYVFYAMQEADKHPLCNIRLDNYFNWTWTYKFYSDIFTPFIEVRDKKTGKIVAPDRNIVWKTGESEFLTNKNDTELVNKKRKAVISVLNKCRKTAPNVMISLPKFRKSLAEFSLVLDIYGCEEDMQCPKDGCAPIIKRDYYFYLVHDYSVSEDYVTDEVLKAYDNNAVPIIVGGADYTKFLPDNSYINFQFYTEEKLAALIEYTIRTPSVYQQYFQWKKYYTIRKSNHFKGYCELCKMLNDKKKFQRFSSYEKFRTWWFVGSLRNKCYPKGAERIEEVMDYLNGSTRY